MIENSRFEVWIEDLHRDLSLFFRPYLGRQQTPSDLDEIGSNLINAFHWDFSKVEILSRNKLIEFMRGMNTWNPDSLVPLLGEVVVISLGDDPVTAENHFLLTPADNNEFAKILAAKSVRSFLSKLITVN